ncbi:unnamed protein product, partial [Ectocarpus fasciculatus]
QEAHESESRRTVNQILDATNLKNFSKMQFFMLTNGSGEEQDKQVKYMREQVKRSPKVEVSATEGLRLTTEVKSDDLDGKGSDDGSNSSRSSNTSRRSSKRMSWKKGKIIPPQQRERCRVYTGSTRVNRSQNHLVIFVVEYP